MYRTSKLAALAAMACAGLLMASSAPAAEYASAGSVTKQNCYNYSAQADALPMKGDAVNTAYNTFGAIDAQAMEHKAGAAIVTSASQKPAADATVKHLQTMTLDVAGQKDPRAVKHAG